MKIIFSDIDGEVAAALARDFAGVGVVEVHHGDIFEHAGDAIVSPANSFGHMDGGIDLAYSRRFGWDVQSRLQELIRERHGGELLVGEWEVVPTGDEHTPHLISVPTMRVPMDIRGTVNPYLAFRAALRACRGRGFGSMVCPGLGTCVGKMDPAVAAGQMRIAHLEFFGSVDFGEGDIRSRYRDHHRIARGLLG